MLREAGSSRCTEVRTATPDSTSGQRLAFAVLLLEFTAVLATALKLASATSLACLTAFCTDSRALLPAATALLDTATAVSEPAGAFLAALSTTARNFFCTSANWPSKVRPNSAPVEDEMSYRWRV